MRTIQILIDIIAIVCFIVAIIVGKTEVQTWVALIWVVVALIAHIQNDDEYLDHIW